MLGTLAPELTGNSQVEAADWFRLPFAIEPETSDTGTQWALRETGTSGFWELSAPLVPVDAHPPLPTGGQ